MVKDTKQLSWEEAVLWLREQPDQADLVRNCYYDDPLSESAERYYRSTEWKTVQIFLQRAAKGTALDLGAGRGISSYALAKDGWKVTSLEPDKSRVVGARAIRLLADEARLDISVIEDWGEQIPCANNSFDLAYMRQVLHHTRDLPAFCREVSRVLKAGGLFIATREHVISKKEDLQKFLDAHPLHRLYRGEHAYLLKEYVKAIEAAGIKLQHIHNPFQSNINLFPETNESLKRIVAKKLFFPWPQAIPDGLLTILGALINTPGRLYSFIGRKR